MKKFLFLIIVFSNTLYSQQITNPEWRNYLNSESVQAIAEEGSFVWIGSQAGLTRLNKFTYEKEYYNKGNSILPSNIIFDVKVDQQGYKWVATFKGLIKFKDDYWILYDTTNSGIPKNDIRTIEIDSLGNIWVGTRGGGLGKFNGVVWEVFNTANSNLPSNIVNDLEFENANSLWIGTTEGLVKKEGFNWTTYNTSNSGLTINNISVIKMDGNIKWIGVISGNYQNPNGGVFRFDDVTWINLMPSRPNRNYNSVYSISIDSNNNKWIAANYFDPPYGGGLFLIDSLDNSIQALSINLPWGWVNEIYIDSQNIKWFGTNYGFAKQDQITETIEISNSKFGHNQILGLHIDRQTNKKYFSSYGDIPLSGMSIDPGFFSILNDTTWSLYNGNNLPFYFGVYTFTISSDGDIYAAPYQVFSNDYLYRFDGINWNLIPTPFNNQISYLFHDGEILWVYYSNWNILYKYQNNIWTEITNSPCVEIRQILKSNNGYWFACSNGLAKLEGNIWSLYTTSNSGLPHNNLSSLTIDQQDNIWIGTFNGLAKFDGSNWIVYNSENSPLIYDNVSALVCDKLNRIYIGSDYGLFKKYGNDWHFFNSNNSGLPNGYATMYGYFIDRNNINALAVDSLNNIWIATNGGVGVYDEDGIPVPVELISFTSLVNNGNVTLNWKTATETNNQVFEVERKKLNKNWLKIGFVNGNGTTTETKTYSFIDKNLSVGKYQYRLKQIDFDGTFEYSIKIEVEIDAPTKFSLPQNYPNPFNPSTKISWQSPVGSWQTLKVYDILGNEVATLVNEERYAGSYEIEFNPESSIKNPASGVYFYQLRAGDYVETKKMILLK